MRNNPQESRHATSIVCPRQTNDKDQLGRFGGVATPPNAIVSPGFAGRAGRLRASAIISRNSAKRRSHFADKQSGHATSIACPRYSLVFWDWNGTLLDDRDYAIGVRNRTFPRFGLPQIGSLEEYYAQFTFPVRLYYDRAGVTEENFVQVANAWMDEYVRGAESIPLHNGAVSALNAFREAGLSQVVLSASDTAILGKQLAYYGLTDYFTDVLGLSHIYATSKQAIGQAYLEASGTAPQACVLLGDTLHDAEVAREMGVHCMLIAGGHQSAETLKTSGCPVFSSLEDAAAQVLGQFYT
jgi:phosphoglycolate phosphatase